MTWTVIGTLVGVAGVAATIVIAVVSHRRSDAERRMARCQRTLDELLVPLEGYFVQTRRIADELRGDLADLEYPHLVHYFDGLPSDDPRKVNWRASIRRDGTGSVR
jgi:hypothetical protein